MYCLLLHYSHFLQWRSSTPLWLHVLHIFFFTSPEKVNLQNHTTNTPCQSSSLITSSRVLLKLLQPRLWESYLVSLCWRRRRYCCSLAFIRRSAFRLTDPLFGIFFEQLQRPLACMPPVLATLHTPVVF